MRLLGMASARDRSNRTALPQSACGTLSHLSDLYRCPMLSLLPWTSPCLPFWGSSEVGHSCSCVVLSLYDYAYIALLIITSSKHMALSHGPSVSTPSGD